MLTQQWTVSFHEKSAVCYFYEHEQFWEKIKLSSSRKPLIRIEHEISSESLSCFKKPLSAEHQQRRHCIDLFVERTVKQDLCSSQAYHVHVHNQFWLVSYFEHRSRPSIYHTFYCVRIFGEKFCRQCLFWFQETTAQHFCTNQFEHGFGAAIDAEHAINH